MQSKKDSFVFYRSFYEAIKELSDEQQLICYRAICKYVFENEEEKNQIAKALMISWKNAIDTAYARYNTSVENGKKGGAPKGNQNAKKQPKNNLKQPKTTLYDKCNMLNVKCNMLNNNKNNIYSATESHNIDTNDNKSNINVIKEIVDYLNAKVGSNYKYTTTTTQGKINARLNEGFSLDDFKKVIDVKTGEWLNDKDMSKYLRPETLFGTKFEGYLNQNVKSKEKEEPLKPKEYSLRNINTGEIYTSRYLSDIRRLIQSGEWEDYEV